MILMTLNYRGLANPSKKLALKRLVEEINPSIILLQEIMTKGEKTIHELSKILGRWDFSFIDVIGRLGEI
jgi:hypothetical protein